MKVNAIGINYNHKSQFFINRPNGSGDYLFICFRTGAILNLNGKEVTADKNSAIIYNKGTPQIYRAAQASYVNDFIHFDAEGDRDIRNLPLDTVMSLPSTKQISKIMKDIYLEYISNNANRFDSMDLLMKLLFVKTNELVAYKPQDTKLYGYFDDLLNLRSMIYRHPEEKWTIERLSEQVNLSASHFQRLYKKTFGTSPIADVISCKLQFAKTSLSATDDTVHDIAAQYGYDNEEHFMRQFKKETGITPTEYRLSQRE
ncbi:MAG: DNA-binding protein, AraC-type [Firmicutes bacterium]|nr:DNA-binding protein, AraC-type [Bacillota bacterium]